MCLCPSVQKSAGGSSSNGNGGEKIENADGTVTYQDPLDMYCEDNPETDECRSAIENHHQTCHQTCSKRTNKQFHGCCLPVEPWLVHEGSSVMLLWCIWKSFIGFAVGLEDDICLAISAHSAYGLVSNALSMHTVLCTSGGESTIWLS